LPAKIFIHCKRDRRFGTQKIRLLNSLVDSDGPFSIALFRA
jgi:hypothetical protein